MAKKYYAVKVGKVPGIYLSWEECKNQVDGFPGAVYKSFTLKEEAQNFIESMNSVNEVNDESENYAIAYVDGSYSKELQKYSYGCVIQFESNKVELSGSDNDPQYLEMNNVAGEIWGSVNAIKWAMDNNVKSINIYHDYEGIAKWANGEWKTNKLGTKKYQEFIKKSSEKIQIRFTKVAAHTGVELNELADRLAKNALMIDVKEANLKVDLTVVETIFVNIMKIKPDDKERKNIIINNLYISDKRLIEYIKQLWSVSGKKKSDIKSIDYSLDLQNKILDVDITEKGEIQHRKKIYLVNVL